MTVPSLELRLTASPDAVPAARRRLVAFAHRHGAGRGLSDDVGRALTEALAGLVEHARLKGNEELVVEADLEHGVLEVVIADRGSASRPVREPDERGSGISAIALSCEDFTIRRGESSGVEIWMRFLVDR